MNNYQIFDMGIGDWGLGIGDWAQSPIPNPQSPIPNPHKGYQIFDNYSINIIYKILNIKYLFIYKLKKIYYQLKELFLFFLV